MKVPRAFVSHNSADKPTAEHLARTLRSHGVDAWFDQWEIAPGDSLVRKIFDEGLKDCTLFIVLLSPESVASNWVRHELDVGLVRRIEEKTRVVPVLVRTCEIPEALKPLRRLDATRDMTEAVAELVDIAHGRWGANKPPVDRSSLIPRSRLDGYSDYAWSIAQKILPELIKTGRPGWCMAGQFADGLEITPQQFEDALAELRDDGVIKFRGTISRDPFDVGVLQPTAELAVRMAQAGIVDFDPIADVKTVMVAIAAAGRISALDLHDQTGLTLARLHIAVELVHHVGLAQVYMCIAPTYGFAQVNATSETRRWVRQHTM